MGNISHRIDAIIEARKQRLIAIQDAMEKAEKCKKAVSAFRSVQQSLDPTKADAIGLPEEIVQRMRAISFTAYDDAYKAVTTELERLEKRFSREKINISFVGRAGQGKSLVLQQISGLGESVIPSAEGSDCTGAKSIITNTPGTEKPYADITFFTESEMVEIVNVYLKEIFGTDNHNIRSLDEVSTLPDQLNDSTISSTKEPKKRELRKYIDHMEELRENLGKRPRRIEEDEIEEYVAMYKCTDKSVKYYKYLSVKCADIHCSFPKKDAGSIILVDTIGMGSQSLGVGESLMDTVKNDSDAVIYMQRPDPKRSHLGEEDTLISNEIIANIREDCAKKMMFWVLNQVSSGEACNLDGVKIVEQEFQEARYPIASLLTVDCKSEEQVENKLLTPVLETISQNIDDIDKIYLEQAAELMDSLYSAYKSICDQVVKAQAEDSSFPEEQSSVIDDTISSKIKNEVRNTFHRYWKHANEDCQPMMEKMQEILHNLPTLIPSKDEILNYLGRNNRPIDTYIHSTDIMRLRIINAFLKLDETLLIETTSMKNEIVQIMTDSSQGALGFVVPYQFEKGDPAFQNAPMEWIDRFITINETTKHFNLLRDALERLKRFNVSVEGFLIHEIRYTLTQIDTSRQNSTPPLPEYDPDIVEDIAEQIIDYLKDAVFNIQGTLRKKVAEFYKYPNKALYAAAKDFHDRISYAEIDTHITIENAWKELYKKWCRKIWTNEASVFMSNQKEAKELNDAVTQLHEFDRKENFVLMK